MKKLIIPALVFSLTFIGGCAEKNGSVSQRYFVDAEVTGATAAPTPSDGKYTLFYSEGISQTELYGHALKRVVLYKR